MEYFRELLSVRPMEIEEIREKGGSPAGEKSYEAEILFVTASS